jgi:hypothetical protein
MTVLPAINCDVLRAENVSSGRYEMYFVSLSLLVMLILKAENVSSGILILFGNLSSADTKTPSNCIKKMPI